MLVLYNDRCIHVDVEGMNENDKCIDGGQWLEAVWLYADVKTELRRYRRNQQSNRKKEIHSRFITCVLL